jgi:hypothetical protein
MKKLLMLFCLVVQARDPFQYGDGYHCLMCISVGSINDHCIVAQVILDGVAYTVKQGDLVESYSVVSLSQQGVMLRDPKGGLYFLELAKKRPFNLCKLKG